MQKVNERNATIADQPPVLVIAGPTASGKSHLAILVAEAFGGEIVNADSMQVYRELAILTARPSPDDETRVPHHLYGIQSVSEVSSAGAWLKTAVHVIDDIRRRGRWPIVCGGTGLYLKVLREGIAPVPDIPADVFDVARRLYEEEGAVAFHERLVAVDSAAADRLPPADRQRLIRAYAVKQATGRTLDEWQAMQSAEPPLEGPFFTVVLTPPRDALYARIDQRFNAMLDAGALEEVTALDPKLDVSLPALKALGVSEFRRHIDGQCELADAVAIAQQLTRNFAKRQGTWFRNQLTADLEIEGFGDQADGDVCREIAATFPDRTLMPKLNRKD